MAYRCIACEARRAGWEEMREEAARWLNDQWGIHASYTARELADAIRALPLEGTGKEGGHR